jgi:hypothetical protein
MSPPRRPTHLLLGVHSSMQHVFRLPRNPGSVAIASRVGVPSELGIARDPRSLGVALRRVAVRQGAKFMLLDADDERLTVGFHAYEADGRRGHGATDPAQHPADGHTSEIQRRTIQRSAAVRRIRPLRDPLPAIGRRRRVPPRTSHTALDRARRRAAARWPAPTGPCAEKILSPGRKVPYLLHEPILHTQRIARESSIFEKQRKSSH